jgi:hypothetical protein
MDSTDLLPSWLDRITLLLILVHRVRVLLRVVPL